MISVRFFAFLLPLLVVCEANANCTLVRPTDAQPPTGVQPSPAQSLNEAFPATLPAGTPPWRRVDFKTNPSAYADLLKGIAKSSIEIQAGKIRIDRQQWWSTPFMNYTNNGREHFNGLTKERSPRLGDLAPNSPANFQVWAVGWYNEPGAFQLGKIWQNRCQPDETAARLFPEHTLSIKLLFTNAPPTIVRYLQGSPEIPAAIDPPTSAGPIGNRVMGTLRLLQVDFAVKDDRAQSTGWVFGTFVWMAPRNGDGLWDNLELVGLHWGNDPGKQSGLQEGYMNPAMQGKTWGWQARPFMGFLGRVNGPADNKTSSCLSCHARAQLPRAQGGIANSNLPNMGDTNAVNAHLNLYFQNTPAGAIASPVPNAVPLDYSLQVMNAWERQCAACAAGDVSGPAPRVCRLIPATQGLTQCAGGVMEAFRNLNARPALRALIEAPPPRQ